MPFPGEDTMKLSKEKQRTFSLIVLAAAVAVGGLSFGLIKPQYETLANIAQKKAVARGKLQEMQNAVTRRDAVEAEKDETVRTLSELENGMASGDLYSWVFTTLRTFKLPYKVDIPSFSPITVANVNLLPNFPYKQATLTLSGTAYFHDLGKFLADFENHFPHIRVLNLEIEPATGEREKLLFKMDIVALVKPNT
jgi:hypothetical protein